MMWPPEHTSRGASNTHSTSFIEDRAKVEEEPKTTLKDCLSFHHMQQYCGVGCGQTCALFHLSPLCCHRQPINTRVNSSTSPLMLWVGNAREASKSRHSPCHRPSCQSYAPKIHERCTDRQVLDDNMSVTHSLTSGYHLVCWWWTGTPNNQQSIINSSLQGRPPSSFRKTLFIDGYQKSVSETT